jgi:solute carrier family 35 protein F1/2
MRPKYHWTQILVSHISLLPVNYTLIWTPNLQGVLICVSGLAMLVGSDVITDKNWTALSRGKGDGLMIAGATLYGISAFSLLLLPPGLNSP